MSDKLFLGNTQDGNAVYVDVKTSHAATHFQHHPALLETVQSLIPTLELAGNLVRIEVDTGVEVGHTDLVRTDEDDEIVYALRPRRTQYSRFVKGKKPMPCTWVTLDLRKSDEHVYELYTAFIGKLTPSFPGGDYLPEQSTEFWSKHALVWGSQEVIPGTETTDCPW